MDKTKEQSESGPIKVVADAAVVIVIEKLRKLRSTEEVSLCLGLKGQVDDVIPKLEVVYEFLKDKSWREGHSEWTDRLLRAIYNAEDKIDIFMCRIVRQEQQTIRIAPDVLMTIWWKCLFYGEMKSFIREVDELLRDQHLNVRDTTKLDHLIKRPESQVSQKETILESQYYQRWQKVNAEGEDPAYIGDYRSDEYEKVIKRLFEGGDELSGRAIYGDEGSGKTYLVGRVFNDCRIRNRFERRAWVHVTNNLTLKDIRYEVLKQVKALDTVLKNHEHMDEEGVKQALLKELGDKRYLIVLDDFHNVNIWYELIRYLPDWYKGSRILVTTRSEDTAYATDYWYPPRLINLGKEHSKQLLQKKVKPEIPNLENEDIHVIIQASNGLPLAIGLLGGLLLNSSPKGLQLQIENLSLQEILTLSYNNLPREEKPCFLYLTLFPKATPITVRRILRLWLGEGLLTGSDKISHEDLGVKYLEDLIKRNLVEVVSWKPDGTPWTCQVVTSMYDMFYTQAVNVGLLRINQKERDTDLSQKEPVGYKGPQFKVRWLAEHSNVKSFCQFDSYLINHMRSFISFYTRKGILTKDLGTFLRTVTSHSSFQLLRVLDLEGVYKPYLHDTIGRLVLLKYLGLRSTVLDTLPNHVGCLQELETLDIKNTNITNLTDSIWKFGCLRHLYLNGFHVDPKILRRSSRFLANLRTLSGLYVGNISENLVSGLVASVTNLTTPKIYYKSTDEPHSITRWISKLTNLHSLKLGIISSEEEKKLGNISGKKKGESGYISGEKKEKSGNIEKDKESTLVQLPNLTYLPEHHHLFNLYLLGKHPKLDANQLPPCLRVLTLSMSKLSIDPMPSLGQLHYLRTLRLLANSYMGEKMKCSKEGFPSLRVLKIWGLTKLQGLTVGDGCMGNLKELEIRDCAKLKFENVISLVHLPSLGELTLTKMPKEFVEDARKRKDELRKSYYFFESGTKQPPKPEHQEQMKEEKGEVLQKKETEEGKGDNEATTLQQGSNQPEEEEEREDSREELPVAAMMK